MSKCKCKVCNNLVDEDDWLVCQECLDKAKNFENAIDIGNSWKENVTINGFYQHCFSEQDINDILYATFKSLSADEQKNLIDTYCEEDMLYFVRWITKKWKEEQ